MDMTEVKAFNSELSGLYDNKPPISKAKMSAITRGAIKAIKFYKHVVHSVEKFIAKCKPEYKVPGLYVIDSIVRQSRHQFGQDKDVFVPRFAKNMQQTCAHLFRCPPEDKRNIIRVLNLWQKNSVFSPEVIQPLLDMADPNHPIHLEIQQQQNSANGNTLNISGASMEQKISPVPPPHPVSNEQSSHREFSHRESSHRDNSHRDTSHREGSYRDNAHRDQSSSKFKKLLNDDFEYESEDDVCAAPEPPPAPPPQPPVASMFSQQNTADALGSILTNPEILRQLQSLQAQMSLMTGMQLGNMVVPDIQLPSGNPPPMPPFLNNQMHQEQNKAEAAEENAKEESDIEFVESGPQVIEIDANDSRSFQTNVSYPMAVSRWQPAAEEETKHIHDVSPTPTRSRRRRSRSRTRRRSRSRSHSRKGRRKEKERDRERDKEKDAEREAEVERRIRGMPPIKKDNLSVCTTTLWVGHLSKLVTQEELSNLFGEVGGVATIDMVAPRGCAFIVMERRRDAARALDKLERYKLHSKSMSIAWAPGKGVKGREWKEYWEADYGVSYLPWEKLQQQWQLGLLDMDALEEGGWIDDDTLPPWLPPRSMPPQPGMEGNMMMPPGGPPPLMPLPPGMEGNIMMPPGGPPPLMPPQPGMEGNMMMPPGGPPPLMPPMPGMPPRLPLPPNLAGQIPPPGMPPFMLPPGLIPGMPMHIPPPAGLPPNIGPPGWGAPVGIANVVHTDDAMELDTEDPAEETDSQPATQSDQEMHGMMIPPPVFNMPPPLPSQSDNENETAEPKEPAQKETAHKEEEKDREKDRDRRERDRRDRDRRGDRRDRDRDRDRRDRDRDRDDRRDTRETRDTRDARDTRESKEKDKDRDREKSRDKDRDRGRDRRDRDRDRSDKDRHRERERSPRNFAPPPPQESSEKSLQDRLWEMANGNGKPPPVKEQTIEEPRAHAQPQRMDRPAPRGERHDPPPQPLLDNPPDVEKPGNEGGWTQLPPPMHQPPVMPPFRADLRLRAPFRGPPRGPWMEGMGPRFNGPPPLFNRPPFLRPPLLGDGPMFDGPPLFDRLPFSRPPFDMMNRPPFDGNRPPFERPPFDCPRFDGPRFVGPPFNGPPFDGPPRPNFDGPNRPFDAVNRPPFDGPPQFNQPGERYSQHPSDFEEQSDSFDRNSQNQGFEEREYEGWNRENNQRRDWDVRGRDHERGDSAQDNQDGRRDQERGDSPKENKDRRRDRERGDGPQDNQDHRCDARGDNHQDNQDRRRNREKGDIPQNNQDRRRDRERGDGPQDNQDHRRDCVRGDNPQDNQDRRRNREKGDSPQDNQDRRRNRDNDKNTRERRPRDRDRKSSRWGNWEEEAQQYNENQQSEYTENQSNDVDHLDSSEFYLNETTDILGSIRNETDNAPISNVNESFNNDQDTASISNVNEFTSNYVDTEENNVAFNNENSATEQFIQHQEQKAEQESKTNEQSDLHHRVSENVVEKEQISSIEDDIGELFEKQLDAEEIVSETLNLQLLEQNETEKIFNQTETSKSLVEPSENTYLWQEDVAQHEECSPNNQYEADPQHEDEKSNNQNTEIIAFKNKLSPHNQHVLYTPPRDEEANRQFEIPDGFGEKSLVINQDISEKSKTPPPAESSALAEQKDEMDMFSPGDV